MTKTEKMRWQKLCETLATEPSYARRASAAASLRRTIAEERKQAITPDDASLLRVAEKVFAFLEERRWRRRSTSAQDRNSISPRSSGDGPSVPSVDFAEIFVSG